MSAQSFQELVSAASEILARCAARADECEATLRQTGNQYAALTEIADYQEAKASLSRAGIVLLKLQRITDPRVLGFMAAMSPEDLVEMMMEEYSARY